MHLRGPMNVSQLAVYQLPDEIHTMQKRTTVPFYNRRRALKQQEPPMATNVTTRPTQSTLSSWFDVSNKRTYNTTASCIPNIVTKTVTVKAVCSSTSTPQTSSNTTYVGPSLLCLPTSTTTSIIGSSPPRPDCPYEGHQDLDPIFQRPNGQVFVSPAPASAPTPVFQRLNGQPFDIPVPSPSSIVKRKGSDWSRIAYYTSTAPAQATGLSFMANLGDPQKSGTFD
jgi:hypothetical protein